MRAFCTSCVSLLLLCAVAWGGDMSVTLDGADDYVDISTVVSDISAADQGTITIWVNPVDATPISAELIWSYSDPDQFDVIHVYINTSGTIIIYARPSTAGVQWILNTDGAAFSDGAWSHIAVAHNGTEATIYIDGVAVAQTFSTSVDKTLWWSGIVGADTMLLGKTDYNSGGMVGFLHGQIASPLIYDRALTQQEIATIYKTGQRTYPHDSRVLDLDTPAGYATGDSMDGLTFPDRSGSGNDGTGVDGANNTGLTKAGTIVRKRGAKQQ